MHRGLHCCRYLQRLPPYLAYWNAGLLAISLQASGRSCDQPPCSRFSLIFVGPGASAELVPTFYLALNSSLEVFPKFLSKTQPNQCCQTFFLTMQPSQYNIQNLTVILTSFPLLCTPAIRFQPSLQLHFQPRTFLTVYLYQKNERALSRNLHNN